MAGSTLAGSVVEIRHAGHGFPGGPAKVLRPSRGLPCREEGCGRCCERRGGFRFPWIRRLKLGMERLSLDWLALPATEARLVDTIPHPWYTAVRGYRLAGEGTEPLRPLQSPTVWSVCSKRMRALRAAWLEHSA